jgi:hypothetical protein
LTPSNRLSVSGVVEGSTASDIRLDREQ